MDEWLRAKVEALGLDVDVYVDYARGILEDTDTDLSERVQCVIDIFTGAMDDDSSSSAVDELDPAHMARDVERLLADSKSQQQQEEEAKRVEAQLRSLQLQEQEKREVARAQELEQEKLRARQHMSREELAMREQLVTEYGFSAISEYDEEGNVIRTNDKDAPSEQEEPNVGQNMNRMRVKQEQAAMRERLKQEHATKVQRDKDQLEREKQRKEKAKKRTMKREKQRGCG